MDIGDLGNDIAQGVGTVFQGALKTLGSFVSQLDSGLQDIWKDLAQFAPGLCQRVEGAIGDSPFLAEAIPLAYAGLLFARVPDPVYSLHRTLDVYFAGELTSLFHQRVRTAEQDLIQKVEALKSAKANLVALHTEQGEKIHGELSSLVDIFSGEAAASIAEADAALQTYQKRLMQEMTDSIAADEQFIRDVAPVLDRLAHAGSTEIPQVFFVVGAVMIGSEETPAVLVPVWDLIVLIVLLLLVIAVLVYLALHPSPYQQALTDLQNTTQRWASRSAPTATATLETPPTPPGVKPPKGFPTWLVVVLGVSVVAGGVAIYEAIEGKGKTKTYPPRPTGTPFPPIPAGTPVPTLTSEQQQLAQDLAQQYPECGVADFEDLLQRILAKYPGMGLDQLRIIADGLRLLSQLLGIEAAFQALNYPGLKSFRPNAVGPELESLIDKFYHDKNGNPINPSQWTQKLLNSEQIAYNHSCSVLGVTRIINPTDIDHEIPDCAGGSYDVDAYRPGVLTEVKGGNNVQPVDIAFQILHSYLTSLSCQNPPVTSIEIYLTGSPRFQGDFQQEMINRMFDQNSAAYGKPELQKLYPGDTDAQIKAKLSSLLNVVRQPIPTCPPAPTWCKR